ncbi:MAG TPA: erythromycin esterase family protein, partial [Chthoniobacterales bacterium]|nr:erythromycin esterase family protein [Chthoniobacterales bacterium]
MNASQSARYVRNYAQPITSQGEFDSLMESAGKAQFVLIGEASHGTEEFYALRAALTKRLIEEHGFVGVALEADWPDTTRIHRYVTGQSNDSSTLALADFQRFPRWMWRNKVMLQFIEWLHNRNASEGFKQGCPGVFGLDLYSMYTSIDAVLDYLEKHDPDEAKEARARYACLEQFGREPQMYGLATTRYGKEPCEEEVVAQLLALRQRSVELMSCDGPMAKEDFFFAEQNARLIRNAERYYRSMFHGRDESWNLRDTHMFETLCELASYRDETQAKNLPSLSTEPAMGFVTPVLERIVSSPSTTTYGRLDECGVGLEFGLGQYEAYSPASKSFVRLASSASTASRNDGDEISAPESSGMPYTFRALCSEALCPSSASATLKTGSKFVVWAHNSHLGDAQATEMKDRGELNLGQLMREHFKDRTFSIGFSTYCGTVTAAQDW